MTREEAIKYGIEWLKDEYLDAKDGAFIKIALEALKQEPCDAISRQAVKELYYIDGYISFRKICELPPVTPQTKTGHWIKIDNALYKWECSECKKGERFRHTYCPNCHARMENEDKE